MYGVTTSRSFLEVPPQGGGGDRHIETIKETTPGLLLDMREVVVITNALKD